MVFSTRTYVCKQVSTRLTNVRYVYDYVCVHIIKHGRIKKLKNTIQKFAFYSRLAKYTEGELVMLQINKQHYS